MPDAIVQQPPTKQILDLCDDCDALIRKYTFAYNHLRKKIGRFESDLEVYIILNLLIRHMEGVCQLARNDLVLLPSAIVLARAAFEASIRARWMLRPRDPFERETRWVVYLKTAYDHYQKLADDSYATPEHRARLTDAGHHYGDFAETVAKMLVDKGYTIPKKLPHLKQMLSDLRIEGAYGYYVHLSAYTHSNFVAGRLYCQNLGCGKQLGEFIIPADWEIPLDVVWKSVFGTAYEFLGRLDVDINEFDGPRQVRVFDLHLQLLRDTQHNISTVPTPPSPTPRAIPTVSQGL